MKPNMKKYEGIPELLEGCVRDMQTLCSGVVMTLDMQVRAYDLLTLLMEQGKSIDPELISRFRAVYEEGDVDAAYDGQCMRNELKAALEPLEKACADARFEAAAAASLHEFAKETFHTWQTAGIFMRKRALKALRERAGFKLESHRIGNYVAKTFDLMNEAQMNFARSQQALFAADVSYKIQPGLYCRIYEQLTDD